MLAAAAEVLSAHSHLRQHLLRLDMGRLPARMWVRTAPRPPRRYDCSNGAHPLSLTIPPLLAARCTLAAPPCAPPPQNDSPTPPPPTARSQCLSRRRRTPRSSKAADGGLPSRADPNPLTPSHIHTSSSSSSSSQRCSSRRIVLTPLRPRRRRPSPPPRPSRCALPSCRCARRSTSRSTRATTRSRSCTRQVPRPIRHIRSTRARRPALLRPPAR